MSNIHELIYKITALIIWIDEATGKGSVCPYDGDGHWKLKFGLFDKRRKIMLGNGSFYMGSAPSTAIPGDGEAPFRMLWITSPFWIDVNEVTVGDFGHFVKASNFRTTAEYYGHSFVFWMDDETLNYSIKKLGSWWWLDKEASWRSFNHIHENKDKTLLPVNHVSWDDALAYCNWRGGRLPTEREWEYACRGGLEKAKYSWGNSMKVNGSYMANIWQGEFPLRNTKKDGYVLRAPVFSFPCNDYGLNDLIGNVWEWVDEKWFVLPNSHYHYSSNLRVQKGGSYLCHKNHCYRYRCSARTKASRDSTSSNVGFRCVYDVTVK